MRSKLLLSLVVGHWSLVVPHDGRAQSYILRNGAVVPADAVEIRDNSLVSTAGGGQVERRVPFTEIVRLDFPAPPEFASAETELLAGRSAEAAALVEPLVRRFAPFATLPGSPYAEAASLRLRALLASGDTEAAKLAANDLIRIAPTPAAKSLGTLALAELEVRAGRPEIAEIMIEEVAKDTAPEAQARAWLLRAELATRRADHEAAAEAYLRVQAFYGTLEDLMPRTLLGAGLALRAYGDKAMSERILGELMDNYAGTPQAAIARKELGF
jgi:hypothetical protein